MFAESLQSAEDYLKSPVYATVMRLLRVLALLLSLTFRRCISPYSNTAPELLPDAVTAILRESREGMPLEPFFKIVIMLVVFELLREVGIRMPRTVGDAVGIVGSLIVGDAATEAGLASTVVVVVVAITAVCTFIVPMYMNAQLLFPLCVPVRRVFLLVFRRDRRHAAAAFLSGEKRRASASPILSPLAPVVPAGMLDFLLAVPKRSMRRRDWLCRQEK